MMHNIASIFEVLLGGVAIAAKITLGAGAVALLLGLALALIDVFLRIKLARAAIVCFVEWMRNVPALAHLFMLYFGLASVGIRLSAITAAIIGLGLVGAAILHDVFAAGMRALHMGQREAALAAGLTPLQTLCHVLLPQMLRMTLPSLANYAAQLIKDTSIASAIAAPEIMFYARNLVTSTFQTPLIYSLVIVLYAAIVLPSSWLLHRLERRLGAGQ